MNEHPITADELASNALFRDLPGADLETLVSAASRSHLGDGNILFAQDDPAHTLYIVRTGGLVLRTSRHGRSVIVETVGPGQVVGWGAMREGATTLATARAVGRTEVIAIPVDPIIDLAAGGSSQARLLVRRIVGLAASQLEASREQLLQAGREGVITAG
jgi:CRP-like cAMP-binding protein